MVQLSKLPSVRFNSPFFRYLLVCILMSPPNCQPQAIQLFFNIAKMLLMRTGQTYHVVLSNILVLLLGLIPPGNQEWPIMPSTMAGFHQFHILNSTNQHALVSILPVPTAFILTDCSHAYPCIQEIAAFVLILLP